MSQSFACLEEMLSRKVGSGSILKAHYRLREFLYKLAELEFDPKQFGLHSLRSGGATVAANAGIPDTLFKRHGWW